MERVYIFYCDRIIGDEEKRTIIENMEGKAEVILIILRGMTGIRI